MEVRGFELGEQGDVEVSRGDSGFQGSASRGEARAAGAGSGVESAVCLRPACGLQLRGVGASAQKPVFQFCLPCLQSPSTPLATRARGQIPEFSVSSVFPGASDGKEFAYNAGDLGSIPGSEKSPGGGHGNPLQYSGLENSMDRGACGQQSMGSQGVSHD